MNSCSVCNKQINRLDNLKRHEKNCKLKNDQEDKNSPINHDLINKIINSKHRSLPSTEIKDEVIKVKLPDLNVSTVHKPKVRKLSFHATHPTQQLLTSSEENLKEKLRSLYAEYISGNATVKQQILGILKELCNRGVINDTECTSMRHAMDNSTSEESSQDSESDLSDSEWEDLEFYKLIDSTVENLNRNTRRNLYKTLKVWNKDISEKIKNYMNGEGEFEDILAKYAKPNDEMKVKMLLKSMKHTKSRITKVLETLRNTEEKEVGKVLETLKMHEQISDQEFHRLLSSANDILSYAKAIQGCGLWV